MGEWENDQRGEEDDVDGSSEMNGGDAVAKGVEKQERCCAEGAGECREACYMIHSKRGVVQEAECSYGA
jgi:hypothetical protein